MPSGYYRSLTVDHTKVPSTQTDFPVLVSLSDTTLKTVANGGHVQRSDGFDIGFYSDSGLTTKLKWEIEAYDGSTGTLVVWVKIASLSSSSDTVFYMGYGSTSITTDQSDPVSTWSNNFAGVWHLGNGTTLSVADSLGANNGTNNGVTATAGKVDGGGSFVSASSRYVELGTAIHPAAITYSAWVKATSFPATYNTVIGRNNGTVYSVLYIKSNGKLGPACLDNSSNYRGYDGTGSNTLSTGTWYYLAWTYASGSPGVGYVNGALDGTGTGGSGNPLNLTAISNRIGSESANGRYWDGLIDEARIASVARSADWISAEYNNQNSPGTFATLGTEIAFDVTVNLTGVSASPAIGTGTVTIEGGVVIPPGGATEGIPIRPRRSLHKKVKLTSVSHDLAVIDARALIYVSYKMKGAPMPVVMVGDGAVGLSIELFDEEIAAILSTL